MMKNQHTDEKMVRLGYNWSKNYESYKHAE